MSGVLNRRGMIFFVGYVFMAIAIGAAVDGYTDGETNLTNPIYILGSGLIATFLFQKFSGMWKR